MTEPSTASKLSTRSTSKTSTQSAAGISIFPISLSSWIKSVDEAFASIEMLVDCPRLPASRDRQRLGDELIGAPPQQTLEPLFALDERQRAQMLADVD